MYQHTKFNVHQARGSQDIEQSVYSYVQFGPYTNIMTAQYLEHPYMELERHQNWYTKLMTPIDYDVKRLKAKRDIRKY
jgi:hypothetical protein